MILDRATLLLRLEASLDGARWRALQQVVQAARPGRAYLNGGAVRDLLLGVEPDASDLDVTIVGRDARDVVRQLGGRFTTHDAFLTGTWHLDGFSVDLVTARRETYERPGALPTVTAGTLEHDLARRDFTINAMVIDLQRGELIDRHGGQADLEAGRLRVLHERSWEDDPTRLFRAARYAARFGFELVSPLPPLDADDRVDPVFRVSSAGSPRLAAELDRVFCEARPVAALELLEGWGVLGAAFPSHNRDLAWAARLGADRDALWCWWCRGDALAVAAFSRLGVGLPRGIARLPDVEVLQQQGLPDDPVGRGRVLGDLPLVVLRTLRGALPDDPGLDWWEDQGRHIETAVDGELLIARGHAPGPAFRRALRAAREAAWAGQDPSGQLLAAERAIVGDGDTPGGSQL